MKSISKFILLLGMTTVLIVACSSYQSKSAGKYSHAKQTAPLKVPANLSRSKVGNSYVVPVAVSHGPVPVSIIPPGGVSKAKVPGNPKAKRNSFLTPLFPS